MKCPDLPTELKKVPESGWNVGIRDALFAHFDVASGESLPAYEWAVIVDNGKNRFPVMVRTFLGKNENNEETQTKLADKAGYFIANKLHAGWTPKVGGRCSFIVGEND